MLIISKAKSVKSGRHFSSVHSYRGIEWQSVQMDGEIRVKGNTYFEQWLRDSNSVRSMDVAIFQQPTPSVWSICRLHPWFSDEQQSMLTKKGSNSTSVERYKLLISQRHAVRQCQLQLTTTRKGFIWTRNSSPLSKWRTCQLDAFSVLDDAINIDDLEANCSVWMPFFGRYRSIKI